MRISVNLASRPFVELRPFFARLRIIMGVLAVIAIGIGIALHIENKKLAAAQAQMDELRNRTSAFQQEKRSNESRMRQPANAAVLERAHFLNDLFLHKSFSWTAVMMDLETVLPTGVQVTAIEPAVTADGDVLIRLRVAGDRDRAVQLVRNLERSSRFIAPRISSESTQTKEQAAAAAQAGAAPGGVEFDILANYNPLPATDKKLVVDKITLNTPTKKDDDGVNPHAKLIPIHHGAKSTKHDDGVVLMPFSARPAPKPANGGTR